MKVLLIIFVSIFSVHAAVIKNDVSGLKRKAFSLKEACTKAGFDHLLMVEADSSLIVDCMGRKLNAHEFCKNNEGGDNFIRGFVSASKSQVYCEYAEAVSLTISCDQNHHKYCQNAKVGCGELKDVFANKLELMHSSLTGTPVNLNCHFAISDPLLNTTL